MIAFVLIGLVAATHGSSDAIHPAKTDEEVWGLAQKVGTVPAYETYLKRFAQGVHSEEAIRRLEQQGKPILFAPPPPPAPLTGFSPALTPLQPSTLDPCSVFTINEMKKIEKSGEAQVLFEAERSNRLVDFRAYLAKFPNGVCRGLAEARIQMRERLKASFSRIPGFGPLAPQPKTRAIFTVDDYPVRALANNEQGRATAEWDVAEDGIAESCRVTQSSGSVPIDDATCRIITRRMRYDPARDANGVPIGSTDRMPVVWKLPEEVPPPPAPSR